MNPSLPPLDTPCTVTKVSGAKKTEYCAILKLPGREEQIHTARSDSTSSRQSLDAVLLVLNTTTANINDMVEVEGVKLRVTNVEPVRDVVGKLDHYEVEAMLWK